MCCVEITRRKVIYTVNQFRCIDSVDLYASRKIYVQYVEKVMQSKVFRRAAHVGKVRRLKDSRLVPVDSSNPRNAVLAGH
jgi:hypothetical protein